MFLLPKKTTPECLEVTVSASALIERAQAAVAQNLSNALWRLSGGYPQKISLELIGEAAAHGDRFARSLLQEAGSFLGIGLVGIVNLLNPTLITLGGSLALAAPLSIAGRGRSPSRPRP